MHLDSNHDQRDKDGTVSPVLERSDKDQLYAAWFHELDAWTEYWDIYHPETHGRYYFGDGEMEPGLLSRFLPRTQYPPAWIAWSRMALGINSRRAFLDEVCKDDTASAILEVDALVDRLFEKYFGDATDEDVKTTYLNGIFRFAIDVLPAATERDAKIAEGDWRKPTAGRHTLDGDLMWFAWALQLEAAHAIAGKDAGHPRRSLLLAGVATGCPANFAWRAHRRTRAEYGCNPETVAVLNNRGMQWALDFDASADEVHALYRIREWGHS
jgi:hypothetical protein